MTDAAHPLGTFDHFYKLYERRLQQIEEKIDTVVVMAQRMIGLETAHNEKSAAQADHAKRLGLVENALAGQQASLNTLRWVCAVLVIPTVFLVVQNFMDSRAPTAPAQPIYYAQPQQQPTYYAAPPQQQQFYPAQPPEDLRSRYPTP